MRFKTVVVLVVGLVVSGCSGDAVSVTSQAVVPASTVETTGPSLAVDSLAEVRSAVVQIVTTGTFVPPDGAEASAPGAGSGFIIDESGLAVTNNHVVGGAATIEVYLDGEDRPRNAFVVGVSECSDLAVIDIDGDGYPYLEWYPDDPTVGMAAYAAGFPLGDPEFTLLEGIVSKAHADGESSWASVDAVLEHTADALPGNSGGPLITADGQVLGVVYSGNQVGQGFAISAEVARPVVERLAIGHETDSIGINGEAVFFDETAYGIWVFSVEPGSPADAAGIVAGDLVWTFSDVDIGADGTMAAYCDVLRSHAPGATMNIEVLRSSTGEGLTGQINGRALEVTFSPPPPADDISADEPAEVEYMEYIDASGTLYLEVPTTWTDIEEGFEYYDDGSVAGPALIIAPDADAFLEKRGPGVSFLALWNPGVGFDDLDRILDAAASPDEACRFEGRRDFDGVYYRGRSDIWTGCAPAGTALWSIAALPPNDSRYLVSLIVAAVSEADFDALVRVLETFAVLEG